MTFEVDIRIISVWQLRHAVLTKAGKIYMALNLVTVRSRTRGKSPQEFQFQGIGRLAERRVLDKDNQPIVLDKDGNAVAPTYEKDEKGQPTDKVVLEEGQRFVFVDDISAAGITNNPQEVLDLFGTIPARKVKDAEGNEVDDPSDTPVQRMIDGALNWYNVLARKEASPVTEQVSEDELTPIVSDLIAKGLLTEESSATWRRAVTSGAKAIDMKRVDFAKMTKEYKASQKAA